MLPRKTDVRSSFAYVYDALYGSSKGFISAQTDFIQSVLGPGPASLLDLGCGTGIHVLALSALRHTVTGVDADLLMLEAARRKAPEARLVLADLRRLPFATETGSVSFDGALCLESPLAYLIENADLDAALQSIRGALRKNAKLLIDVFDYPETLGQRPKGAQEACFETEQMRVSVRESHRYEKRARIWTMRQQFSVEEAQGIRRFEVMHRLRIRSIDEYAGALERAGFRVLEARTVYPDAPPESSYERRIILIARR